MRMENEKKQKVGFNIIRDAPTDGHKGFGIGSLSLENVSPVIVDVEAEEAFIDVGAMHGRSQTERKIRFSPDRSTVPEEGAKLYWLVWVTVGRKEEGLYYAGVGACEMVINRPERRGYKSMPEHVNHMDKSLKGKIIVDHMDDKSKKILAGFLKNYNEEFWRLSSGELKSALQAEKE